MGDDTIDESPARSLLMLVGVWLAIVVGFYGWLWLLVLVIRAVHRR